MSGLDRTPPSVRVALVAGFAVVFGLWLAWGYQLSRSLEDVERNVASLHDDYVRGEQALSTLRTNVLLGSIYLRDALIDRASTGRRNEYRGELLRLRTEVEQSLATYVPAGISPAEREHWQRLQTELGEFWASREIAFSDDITTSAQAAALLRSRVVPRRQTILGILDQLEALRADANQRRQIDAAQLYRGVRIRLVSMGGITLAVALLVAAAVSRHVSRLQREIERRRAAEQQNREDLERLSARLVDAQEQERRTLARELHDEVGQALTAVKMDIGIALRSDNAARVRDALEEASELAESTLRGVRDLSQLLHPSVLDDFGLPTTLATYLRSFAQRTGIRAQLAETIDDRPLPEDEVCVYRIVQEALNNIAHHSGATACTVSLSAGAGVLRLVIEDNGRGLPAAVARASSPGGLGLIGMRERAQALGGSLTVGNHAGGGARLVVTLPLRIAKQAPVSDLEMQAG